jgi:hypothetical protein
MYKIAEHVPDTIDPHRRTCKLATQEHNSINSHRCLATIVAKHRCEFIELRSWVVNSNVTRCRSMLRMSQCITQCFQYSAVREEAQVARQCEQRAIGGHRALVQVTTMFYPIDYYVLCMWRHCPALGAPWSSPLGDWWLPECTTS